MRNKKRILFLLTVILCLTGLYSCNKNFLLLWDANNMYVSTRNNIDKDKVKIEFGISVNTINRETDAELFADKDKYAVLFDGSLKNKMINEYGENDFLITYDNRCYYHFVNLKPIVVINMTIILASLTTMGMSSSRSKLKVRTRLNLRVV